ncbi:MAG: D-arabinono-1,4-lactone oxidase, partial [Actinomycetota bacterium]
WRNWSGRQTATPSAVVRPEDEAGFVEAVNRARAEGWTIRAVGASHSHSRVAAPDGLLVDTDGWQGVEDGLVDGIARDPGPATPLVDIRSGTRIHQLGEPLHRLGLGLINQGDIDRQSVAGATATGTHGTGPTLRNISSAVTAVRLVTADGEIVTTDASTEPELFEVARHSLGAVGLVTGLTMRTRERYRLYERQWIAEPDDVMPDIDRLTAATRHFEFFWAPERDLCACKSLDELPADPDDGSAEGPIAEVEQLAKRERRGWSHQIISSIRDDLHTEMEYAVPAEAGPACFAEIRALIGRDFPDLVWPVEYRTLAADDLLISVARDRPTVTISVHQDISLDDRPLFSACEEVFLAHGGRPHWGKVHYRSGPELAELHAGYRRWWELRDRWDPTERFVTADLAALRP